METAAKNAKGWNVRAVATIIEQSESDGRMDWIRQGETGTVAVLRSALQNTLQDWW